LRSRRRRRWRRRMRMRMQAIFRVLVNGEMILAFVFLVTGVCRICEASSDVFYRKVHYE
jgi:hypothetical protein